MRLIVRWRHHGSHCSQFADERFALCSWFLLAVKVGACRIVPGVWKTE